MATSSKQLFTEFSESTSMHGLQRAVNSVSKWRRPIWAVLVICGAAVATYNLAKTLQDFVNYPTSTKISETYKTSLDFPAVTICNLNPARMSLFNRTGKWTDLEASWNEDRLNISERQRELATVLRETDEGVRTEQSHKIKTMIVDCQFDNRKCTHADFQEMPSSKYGSCYTFNGDQFGESRNTTREGQDYGLTIEVDVEAMEYLPLTSTAGLKVLVHPMGITPFPEDEGIVVGTGASTSIGLRRVQVIRSSPPYGVCQSVDSTENSLLDMFGGKYSEPACRKTCYQQEMYSSCHCCDIQYPCLEEKLVKITGINPTGGYIRFCNVSDTYQTDCAENVHEDFMAGKLGCSKRCPPPCDEEQFQYMVSSGTWPSVTFSATFIDKVNAAAQGGMGKYLDFAKDPLFVRNNFLRLVVYDEAMTFQVLESQPLYDWSRLLSDIGGQLGLWLGFSLMTAVEWLELLYDVVLNIGCKLCNRHPNKPHPEGDTLSVS